MGVNIIPDFKTGKYNFVEVNSGEMGCYYVTTNVFKVKRRDKTISHRFGMYASVDEIGNILIEVYAIPTFDMLNAKDILEVIEYGSSAFDLDIKQFIDKVNDESFYDIPMMMAADGISNNARKVDTDRHITNKELFNKAKSKYSLSDNAYYLGVINHYVNNVVDFDRIQDQLSSEGVSSTIALLIQQS